MVVYSIIVPLYNEEQVIDECYERLKKVMDSTKEAYEIILVNDGSRDKTSELAKKLCESDDNIRLLEFSRNFGHQIAITAGMDNASGQAIVVIDADLQDPPEVILEMIKKWKAGYEVVYGRRMRREGETAFKKLTAGLYYRILAKLTNIDIPLDTGDFRLIDRKVCEAMKLITEKNRFVRGLIGWVGFKSTAVEFVRHERYAGTTKYPLRKMLRFALDGITSFSDKPLKIATYVGFSLSLSSFIYLFVVVLLKFTSNTVIGWASTVAVQLFFNGIILIILGIIGEYLGRIYDETKNRPLYILRNRHGFGENQDSEGKGQE